MDGNPNSMAHSGQCGLSADSNRLYHQSKNVSTDFYAEDQEFQDDQDDQQNYRYFGHKNKTLSEFLFFARPAASARRSGRLYRSPKTLRNILSSFPPKCKRQNTVFSLYLCLEHGIMQGMRTDSCKKGYGYAAL